MMIDLLPHARRILQWITLKRVVMLGLGSIVWIVSLTLFENRDKLLESSGNPLINKDYVELKVARDSEEFIKEVVDRHDAVSFMMVVSANIARNQRSLSYFYTDDPVIQVDVDEFSDKNGRNAPLLGASDAVNAAIIRAINGDFACYDSAESLIVPKLNRTVAKICRISIPPYYGQFSGYLTFGLTKDLSPEQLITLRREAVEITSNIYFDNLKRLSPRR